MVRNYSVPIFKVGMVSLCYLYYVVDTHYKYLTKAWYS